MTTMTETMTEDHSHIWYVLTKEDEEDNNNNELETKRGDNSEALPSEDATVVFAVQPNALRRPGQSHLSLEAAARHYCQVRIQGPTPKSRGRSTTHIAVTQLYDVLGLLRALQYDIQQYNTVVEDVQRRRQGQSSATSTTTLPKLTKNERRYACYRLIHQAMELGVRLEPPWQTTGATSSSPTLVKIDGLDELVTFVETTFASSRISPARSLIYDQGVVDFDALQELYRPGVDLLDTNGLLTGLSASPLLVTCRASYFTRGKSALGHPVSTFTASCEFVVATQPGQLAVVEARVFHSEFKGTRRIRQDLVASSPTSEKDGTPSSLGTTTGEMCVLATPETHAALFQQLEARGKLYQQVCSRPPKDKHASGTLVQYTAGSFWPVSLSSSSRSSSSSSTSRANGTGRSSRTGGRLMVDIIEAWSRGIHPAKPPADGMAGEAVTQAFAAMARLHRQQQQQQSDSNHTPSSTTQPNDNNGEDEDDNNDEMDTSMMYESVLWLSSSSADNGGLPLTLLRKTWPVLCGFSLETRLWGLVLVDGLSSVQFHTRAFEELVLPAARKRLLRALITSHNSNHRHKSEKQMGQVDVLPGKGEGKQTLLVFLSSL